MENNEKEEKKKKLKAIKVYISADLDQRFRRLAMEKYGYKKGSISRAAEEAIVAWNRLFDKVKEIKRVEPKEIL